MLSARYVPTREEAEFILAHRDILNVYLKELGLEQISIKDEFWCVDIPSGWHQNWKDFKWSISDAYDKLNKYFVVLGPEENRKTPSKMDAKLFLLLHGWEDLYVEI